MKKQIFCLMLTTAFFATNHLYAMESIGDEEEKARQLKVAMEQDRDAHRALAARLKAEEERQEYIKGVTSDFEQHRKKCTINNGFSVDALIQFKDWQRFNYMAAIGVKTRDIHTVDVVSRKGFKPAEENFFKLLKTDVEFQPLAELFVLVSTADPTDPYQSKKVHAYRSMDGELVIVQTNQQDILRKITEAILGK